MPDPIIAPEVTSEAPVSNNVMPAQPAAPVAPATSAPDAAPSNVNVLPPSVGSAPTGPGPLPKETFGQGFSRASNPRYTLTATGEIIRAESAAKPSLGGVLGRVLAGAMAGASAGAGAQTPEGARGRGAAVSAGISAAQKQAVEKDSRAKMLAQQEFENKNKVAESRMRQSLLNAQAIDLMQRTEHDKALLPSEIEKAGLENDEARGRVDLFHMQSDNLKTAQQEAAANFLSYLSSQNIPYETITHRTASGAGVPSAEGAVPGKAKSVADLSSNVYKQLHPLAPQIAGGTVSLMHSGGTGQDNGVAVLHPEDLKNQPLTADFHYKQYDGSPNPDGTPHWIDRVISVKSADGRQTGATAYDAYVASKGAQMSLSQQQGQLSQNLTNEHVKAQTGQANAAANEANAKAEEARANAAAVGGDMAKNMGERLVEAYEDPGQLSKRAKTYDAFVKAADDYSMAKYGKHWDQGQAAIDFAYAKSSQTQNTLNYLNSLTGRDGKSGNLGELITLSNNIGRTKFPALNNAEAWAKLQAGDPAIAQYKAAVTEVSDQVAKILQGGGSGNGTSDAKLKQAQDLFNTGFNKNQILAISTTMRDLLGNRKAEMVGNNRYLLRQYGSPQQPATAQNPQSGNQPASAGSGESGAGGFFGKFGGRPVE